jgi:hypothetical protein
MGKATVEPDSGVPEKVPLIERADDASIKGTTAEPSQIARHDRFSARLPRVEKRVPFWGGLIVREKG